MLEIMTTLRAYRDALVLVGGWAPYFLLEQFRQPENRFVHVGSIDIDLAVDPAVVRDAEYATIVDLLRERGFEPTVDRRGRAIPASFDRRAPSPLTKKTYTIRIDFLTPPNPQSSARPSHVAVQDELFARKIKGCEIAFRHQLTFPLTGTLPEGGRMTVPVKMVDLVGSLTMKGIVLGERYREKDAYDIYALVSQYGDGPAAAAAAMWPFRDDPLVAESIASIRTAFADRQAHGPAWVAAFLVGSMFGAERDRIMTDAFMQVHEFCRLLEPATV